MSVSRRSTSTRAKNLWFDFGSGAGGDIFTLAGELAGTTDFIRQTEFIARKMQLPVEKPYKPVPFVEEPTFANVEISRLEAPALLKYLADRGIPRDIAQRYCVQVDYTLHGKRYYAIGFENNAHGYELRNLFLREHTRRKTSRISPTATHVATYLKAL